MQIILPQSAIEEAIEDYLRDLVRVPDTTELVIDLAATRGPGGFTAKIDFVRDGETAPVREENPNAEDTQTEAAKPIEVVDKITESATEETTASEALNIPKRTRRTKAEMEAARAAEAEAGSPVEDRSVRTTEEILADSEAAEEAEQEEEEALPEGDASIAEIAEATPVKEAPPARSLFANLGKPLNK